MTCKDELQKRRIFNSCIEIQELEIPIFLEFKKGMRSNDLKKRNDVKSFRSRTLQQLKSLIS